MRNDFGRQVALTLLLLFSFGCATTIPPLNFSVPNVGPSTTKLDAELKSIIVSTARPDEATGKLDWAAETITALWKNSLEEAFIKMAIFKDDGLKKVSLTVKILKYDYPTFGIEMTTHTTARYEIINRSSGGVIFTTDVSSSGVVPGSHAYLGAARVRESASRSVQNNIIKFLQALETVDLSKPMFPASN
jgi:hypothetical protein